MRAFLFLICKCNYCSITLLSFLSKTLSLLESTTKPLIFKATVGVSALDVTVIVFLIGFTLLVSYFTSIFPVSPGKIGIRLRIPLFA